MSIKSSIFIYKCNECNYETYKKYNLNRHFIAKHNSYINNKSDNIINEENVIPNKVKVNPNKEKVISNKEKVIPNFICKKCNKTYKTKKYLFEHETKCIGLDELTCRRCMMSFSTRQSKSRHVLKNNCKPRSVKYARKPNSENVNTNYNIENQNNNIWSS